MREWLEAEFAVVLPFAGRAICMDKVFWYEVRKLEAEHFSLEVVGM